MYVGAENTDAIVLCPAIGFIFFLGGIFAFYFSCLLKEKRDHVGSGMSAQTPSEHNKMTTAIQSIFHCHTALEYVLFISLQHVR